jgi:hypothetical protein
VLSIGELRRTVDANSSWDLSLCSAGNAIVVLFSVVLQWSCPNIMSDRDYIEWVWVNIAIDGHEP